MDLEVLESDFDDVIYIGLSGNEKSYEKATEAGIVAALNYFKE